MIPESQGSLTARVSVMGFEHCNGLLNTVVHPPAGTRMLWLSSNTCGKCMLSISNLGTDLIL